MYVTGLVVEMSNDQISLVEKLADRTARGKIIWEEHPRKGTFQTPFGEYVVTIEEIELQDEPGLIVIEVTVYNADGIALERFTDTTISSGEKNYYETMTKLYESARRNALGTDKAMKEILMRLDQL
jgi:hypothetical protein